MSKCPFSKMCKHYREDSFTCQQEDHYLLRYCGAYRSFFHKRLTNEMNEMIGSLAYASKEELAGP